MFYLSALAIGFLGSFHCVGMCGPIAMALPATSSSRFAFLSGRLLYNMGRIITYSVFGLLAGLAGHTIATAGFQKTVSIVSGVLILLVVLLPLLYTKMKLNGAFIYSFTNKIKLAFKKLFTLRSKFTMFWIGLVNGLLPCGFVYLAVIASLGAPGKMGGMAYMLFFGLGTLPMMFTLSLTGKLVGAKYQPYIRKATPVIAFLMAAFLIWRGIMIQNHSCCHH